MQLVGVSSTIRPHAGRYAYQRATDWSKISAVHA